MAASLPLLLMTRPRAASERFVEQLRARGAPAFAPIYSPLITIEVTGPLPDTRDIKGLIFTSANGVGAYDQLGGPRDLPAYTVGDATAEAARAIGMTAQSADGDAQALIDWLTRVRPAGPLLHVKGEHSRGAVSETLTSRGLETRACVLYKQPALPLSPEAEAALNGQKPVIAPVFSPRTAELLGKTPRKAPLLVAAMSEAVVKPLTTLHIQHLKVAKRPDSRAMQDCTLQLLALASLLERQGRNV